MTQFVIYQKAWKGSTGLSMPTFIYDSVDMMGELIFHSMQLKYFYMVIGHPQQLQTIHALENR